MLVPYSMSHVPTSPPYICSRLATRRRIDTSSLGAVRWPLTAILGLILAFVRWTICLGASPPASASSSWTTASHYRAGLMFQNPLNTFIKCLLAFLASVLWYLRCLKHVTAILVAFQLLPVRELSTDLIILVYLPRSALSSC